MDRSADTKPTIGRFAVYWLYGLLALGACHLGLSYFNTATELTPDHADVLNASFIVAGLAGLASAGVSIWQSRALPLWRRTGSAVAFAVMGLLAVLLVFNTVAELVENALDFPPGKTQTFETYMRIGRAYQSSHSWTIQPEPIWTNIDITEDDFNFMRSHRRPGDLGRDPEEISSKGYFCARVTMQRAGNAFRVLHAGSGTLPKGSIVVCPSTNIFGE